MRNKKERIMATHETFLNMAVDLALQNKVDGGRPFGLSSDHIYEKLKIKEIDAIKITKFKINFL